MNKHKYQEKISALLLKADVRINGDRPWDLKVHNPKLFGRILGQGSLGFGEAYMEGWWDCEHIDQMISKLICGDLQTHVHTLQDKLFYLYAHLRNRQTTQRSLKVGRQHYDVGNDLYEKMLDQQMIYTCGYWQDAQNLDEAQSHKLELVCRKLKLKPGMRVLDIGCGWGGAARYMAKHYDVEVVGITISQEQVAMAKAQSQGLAVDFRFQDYRDINEPFDRIYSLGMFEHVGFKNYRRYFEVAHRCLKEDGLFLLHTIGHRKTTVKVDPWIERYIFPNSILPSAELICRDSAGLFNVEDWHNFGMNYHKTLLAWLDNIDAAWDELPSYNETFQRMWRYYLLCSAGAFMSYRNHLWQVVFSKGQFDQPYQAVRSAVD